METPCPTGPSEPGTEAPCPAALNCADALWMIAFKNTWNATQQPAEAAMTEEADYFEEDTEDAALSREPTAHGGGHFGDMVDMLDGDVIDALKPHFLDEDMVDALKPPAGTVQPEGRAE